MRAPLSWLREFTPIDAPTDEIVSALNRVGLEVDGVEEPGREIGGVVAARVLEVAPHPDADKLVLVDVDFGLGQTRVVCGARNLAVGMTVPYAGEGARLPGGITLEKRKIRGVVSDGMLCSATELGLGDDHSGIFDLGDGNELGVDVRDLLGLDDVVFELAITPNRPDAMCIVGVARELAAAFSLPLTVPEPDPRVDPSAESSGSNISVAVEAPDRCPRYLGWAARVTMGPSPGWMQQRLVKAGMRPISNVVDVTNYVLLERNQPLHAFDLGRLGGSGIVVRLARAGERMATLDGVERALDPADLLICDADSVPQAIAGIMGGRDSEVSGATTEILLESAYFERMGIARSSKRLKLRSESSARFERGIDPAAIATNAARAMELLADVAGASASPEPVDRYPAPVAPRVITARTSKINRVLGTALSDDEIRDALVPLGLEVEGSGDELVVTAPTFRPDLEREVDLVEEVARRVGFDAIGRTVARPTGQIGGLTREQADRRTVADALVGAGCSEAINIPLVAPELLERAGSPVERAVRAANPLRAEESMLRTRILPGLLLAVARNQSHGVPDVALFEVGRVFATPETGALLPDEPSHLAAVLAGSVRRAPVEPDRAVDAYDAVDLARVVLDALELDGYRFVAAERAGFEPGRTAVVESSAGDVLGVVGQVSAAACAAVLVAPPAVAFELDLDRVFAAARRSRSFVAPSEFPHAAIDLAFVVGDEVPAGEIAATLRAAAGDVLEDVRAFDEFRSDALGVGRHSVAFALRFRAPDHTLTDKELASVRRRCIEAVVTAHAAELRG
jgi:phenylalanyl-tRNA synthetase beta chain